MPKVPPVAALWPSSEVVAPQSVSITTLKPFSHAVRIVDSTQQLVRKPHSTTVSMPRATSSASRVVLGKASRPFLPLTTTSPSAGDICSQKAAFHVPSVKRLSLAQPARIPRPLLGLSDASALNMIGTCTTVPPSEVNSFWNSIATRAVLAGTMSQPPLAEAAGNVLNADAVFVADDAFEKEKKGMFAFACGC